jgi:DNA-binding LacI/PurR family transcriptional regulator
MNIHQIAAEAGVSIATVSRVINGKKDVSQETREKILKIMQKKEFKPKVSVAPVVDNIGVFISDDKTKISNPYTSLVLSGLADIVFNQHLSLSLIPSVKIPRDGTEFLNFCRQRRISGGVFLSSTIDDLYIKELGSYVPVVVVGNNLESENVGSVRSDNCSGAYEAVRYLINTGHKKILLVMADMHFADHKDRYEGAKKALEEFNLELNPYNILNTYALTDVDLSYTLEFIVKNSKPDAVFVGGDQEAIRVLRVLQEKGIKIPEDISIVGYDNLPIALSSNPPLTTVNQPIYEVGREAAKMLLEMIKSKKGKAKNILLQEHHLMIRGSVLQRNSTD